MTPADPLQTEMISRRAGIMKEIDFIDGYFKMRGWPIPGEPETKAPEKAAAASQAVTSPLVSPVESLTLVDRDIIVDRNAIRYADEAREFMKTVPVGSEFGPSDFKAYLQKRYPTATLNDHSVRGPFVNLIKNGSVIVSQKGTGKKPVIYRKPLEAPKYFAG